MLNRTDDVRLSADDIEFFLNGDAGPGGQAPSFSKLCDMMEGSSLMADDLCPSLKQPLHDLYACMMTSASENVFDVPADIIGRLISAREDLFQSIESLRGKPDEILNGGLIPLHRGITALAKKLDIPLHERREDTVESFLAESFARVNDMRAKNAMAADMPDSWKELENLIFTPEPKL